MKHAILALLPFFFAACQATELNATLVALLSSYDPIFGLDPSFSWKNASKWTHSLDFAATHDDTLQIKAIPWHHHVVSQSGNSSETLIPLSPYLGEGVDIYIVDSGIDTKHPEFNGRATEIYNPYNSPYYCYDHGTPVASMAAGLVCGTAKSSRIFSVVVGLCNEATVTSTKAYETNLVVTKADAINAFSAIIDHLRQQLDEDKKQAKAAGWSDAQIQAIQIRRSVINISMGHRGASDSMTFATLQMLFDMPNVILVVSAGNEGSDAQHFWPAGDERFFTVGSYNMHSNLSSDSNWGSVVDCYGPGENVLVAQINVPWGYTLITGTSFAAPYVSGWMAAYWSLRPKLMPNQVQQAARARFLNTPVNPHTSMSS